jgi:hypothetical protein
MMEAILRDGNDTVWEFDVVEGDHVYVQRPDDEEDAFLDWDELPDELKDAILKDRKKLEDAFKECSATMTAIVDFYAHAEKRDRVGSGVVAAVA